MKIRFSEQCNASGFFNWPFRHVEKSISSLREELAITVAGTFCAKWAVFLHGEELLPFNAFN